VRRWWGIYWRLAPSGIDGLEEHVRHLAGAAIFVLLATQLAIPVESASQTIYESEPVTATATIDAIDKANRVVTLKVSTGALVDVTAPAEMGLQQPQDWRTSTK
jgi:hypothetical protein